MAQARPALPASGKSAPNREGPCQRDVLACAAGFEAPSTLRRISLAGRGSAGLEAVSMAAAHPGGVTNQRRDLRIMCTVSAWPSHWFPMVGVLWALRAAGHDVRVLCAPSQSAALSSAGLTPVPVLDELDIAFLARLRNVWDAQAGSWPYGWLPPHPVTGEPMGSLEEFGFADFAKASQSKIATPVSRSGETAIGYARESGPDLILAEPLAMEGVLAGRVTGIPAAVHLWGPVGTSETDPVARSVAEYPVDSFRPHKGIGPVTLDTVEHVIDPCPNGLRPAIAAGRLPVRYVPYNGTGALPSWLLKPPERRRICVAWGNSLTRMFGPGSFAVPLILEALAELDAEVVVTTGASDSAAVGSWPDNVRVTEQLPLHLLLPSCAAVVHHGGAGCLMTAVAAGVPQILLPTGMDQPVNAARLTAAGSAVAVPRPTADTASVAEAVSTVLDQPGYAKAARALANQCQARPTPAALVPELEQLAAR